jgi:hypothetical protein
MKIVSALIVIIFLAGVASAQDDLGLLGGGDAFLVDIPRAPGGGARGANRGGARGNQPQQPPVDRLASMKSTLTKAGVPLQPDQEVALNAVLDKEIPSMQAGFRTQFATEIAAMEAARGQDGGAPRGRGGLVIPPDSPMALEVRRLNDELLNKIIAALQPNQQAVLQKIQKDQVRARGLYDFDALKLIMQDAGAPPFTAEQAPQFQKLFTERSQARYQLSQSSQGTADPSQLRSIDADTLQKLLRLMNAAQKKALAESMAKARPQ